MLVLLARAVAACFSVVPSLVQLESVAGSVAVGLGRASATRTHPEEHQRAWASINTRARVAHIGAVVRVREIVVVFQALLKFATLSIARVFLLAPSLKGAVVLFGDELPITQ